MKIFPTKELEFKLIHDQTETLNRLNQRTEESKYLTSSYTDKSFRGIINGNEFKIISSVIGRGAFCVMTGAIESGKGKVKVEIHKAFQVLFSIFLCFPIIGVIVLIMTGQNEPSLILILAAIGQVLIIRYALIGLAFRVLSRKSLNRLRDVINFELIRN